MSLRSLIIAVSWLCTCLNAFVYSIYGLLFLFSSAGKPLGEENFSDIEVIFMSLVFVLLPLFSLWVSRNYDITTFSDGYNKTSEMFFCLLYLPLVLIFLKLFHKQILPVI